MIEGDKMITAEMLPQVLGALLLSGGVTLLLGPLVIPWLKRLKLGQNIRSDGPARHLQKAGTPTMGGLIFLVGISVATVLVAPKTASVFTVLILMTAFGFIGFMDDFLKVALRRSLGLKARQKLVGQICFGLALGILAVNYLGRGTTVVVPFTDLEFNLGPGYLVLVAFVVVAAANAANLTDGLDGLAAGVTAVGALVYVVVALLKGRGDLAVVAGALAGGCLGFLRYNRYPARVFMGDTGSLALGSALACLAVLTETELLLAVIGGVFVLETLSVIIQVISFQLFGRRVFRMSPLHHHFELVGWSERKVVTVFLALAVVFGLLGLLGL
jgi:phospho-N-acetylmuramoyl-pentapeptide-transferase